MRVPHLTAMAAVSALIVGATATAFADPGLLGLGNATIGRQADGSVVTSTGQRVTPAGCHH